MTNKPKRRWYQFSLRSLFVVMTLFAIACSWYAYEMKEAANRRATVAEILELGGHVYYYDPKDPNTPGLGEGCRAGKSDLERQSPRFLREPGIIRPIPASNTVCGLLLRLFRICRELFGGLRRLCE